MKKYFILQSFFLLLLLSASVQSTYLTKYFPKNNDISRWIRSGDVRIFPNAKLWEYIDGGADVYIDYGLLQVATVELKNEKRSIVADIYEFKTIEGAFGMYARERAPTYHFMKIGAEGYHEGVSLNFYQSNFYMKLSAYTDDQKTNAAMQKIATWISQKIGGSKKPPSGLALLPSNGRMKSTETFEMKSYLNKSELRETYTAKYSIKENTFILFCTNAGTAASSATRLKGLKSSLTQIGSMDKDFLGLGDALITGVHHDVKNLVAVAKGKYIFGVHSFTDLKSTADYLRKIVSSLK